MKLESYRQIFEKYSNVKFHDVPSSGSRAVRCGQTDRHDEAKQSLCEILRTRLKSALMHKITRKTRTQELVINAVKLANRQEKNCDE